MKHLFLFIIALMAITPAFGREITGKVVDENNAPLDFVNVVMLKSDSTYIAGTVTDNMGIFMLDDKQDHPKYIKVSSIGYTGRVLDIPASGDLEKSFSSLKPSCSEKLWSGPIVR